jgi:hypothetical protein
VRARPQRPIQSEQKWAKMVFLMSKNGSSDVQVVRGTLATPGKFPRVLILERLAD